MTRNISPSQDCRLCPRLASFREQNCKKFPDKFNAPVPSFGTINASLLIVGLAPGLKGANFTGRPFTGDYAGDMLYATLLNHGFATGNYGRHANDGVELVDCRITNAVRCVPPENKPTGDETKTCRPFLEDELASMSSLRVILSLGKISHDAVLRTCAEKLSNYKFGHGAIHMIDDRFTLIDSYHCSRYNTQTRRLNQEMFDDIFDEIKRLITNNEAQIATG